MHKLLHAVLTIYPYCFFQNSRVFHDGNTSSLGYTLRVSQETVLMLASYFKSLQTERGKIRLTMQTKSLNKPDEIRTLPKTTAEVNELGELPLTQLTLQL